MKQNKVVVIGLLTVVIGIWGSVFFKINEMTSGGSDQSYDMAVREQPIAAPELDKSYSLLANYRDPFLKKEGGRRVVPVAVIQQTKEVDNQSMPAGQALVKMDAPMVNAFDKVMYYGRIGNDNSADEVGFVEYKGKLFVLREGDTVKQVFIKTIASDSLVVQYNKEEVTIHVSTTKKPKG